MRMPRSSHFLLLCMALLTLQIAIWLGLVPDVWAHVRPATRVVLLLSLLFACVHLALLAARFLRARGRQARRRARLQDARRRLARDLHDRVGSRLVNALVMMDGEGPSRAEQRLALELALVELRTVVDGFHLPHRHVQEQLAQLRYRLQPIFEHQGIELEWDVNVRRLPQPEHEELLVLVAQEGLSNVLQHAKASKVRVLLNTLEEAAGWYFEISDDGCGMQRIREDAAPDQGFGTTSMRERLREAGAELAIGPSPLGGLCLRATLVPPAQAGLQPAYGVANCPAFANTGFQTTCDTSLSSWPTRLR